MNAPDKIYRHEKKVNSTWSKSGTMRHVTYSAQRKSDDDIEYIKASKMWAATDALNHVIDEMKVKQTADEQLMRDMGVEMLGVIKFVDKHTNRDELFKYIETVEKAAKRWEVQKDEK